MLTAGEWIKDVWIPQYRWQLVEWLKVRGMKDIDKMPKKQLYAIYFKMRKNNG